MTQATPYKQLRRPLDDRMVAGVCSGVARYANIDPVLVRIAFVVLAVVTWGWSLIAYPVMWLLMPEDPRPEAPLWRDPADPSWGQPADGFTSWPGTPTTTAAPHPPAPQPFVAPQSPVAAEPPVAPQPPVAPEPAVAPMPPAAPGAPQPPAATQPIVTVEPTTVSEPATLAEPNTVAESTTLAEPATVAESATVAEPTIAAHPTVAGEQASAVPTDADAEGKPSVGPQPPAA